MCYLDVIGPGPWLLMDGTTFGFFTGLIIFCFAAIVVSIIVALVVMWIRSGNEPVENKMDPGAEICDKEES